jgi:hypothetical protein
MKIDEKDSNKTLQIKQLDIDYENLKKGLVTIKSRSEVPFIGDTEEVNINIKIDNSCDWVHSRFR